MKKLVLLIVFFIILVLFFIITICIPKNYTYTYKVLSSTVKETYDKNKKSYSFEIKDNEDTYKYAFPMKYSRKRGLIKTIDKKDNCLKVTGSIMGSFYTCKQDNNYVTRFYNIKDQSKEIDSYDNINIFKKIDNKILIWNYNGFVYMNGDNTKDISLFNEDVYELKLITKIDRYLLVADYNQKYYFNNLYLLDSKNGNVKEIKLNRKIYFDSYILGVYKKNVYLFDNNSDIEFVINPFKSTIDKYAYSILIDGKWEKVSLNKLKKKDLTFKKSEAFFFKIADDYLYYVTPVNEVLVVDEKVTRIVESNDKEAYYISGDSLYYVNIDKGISKIMSYTEWQFNNSNIYIF